MALIDEENPFLTATAEGDPVRSDSTPLTKILFPLHIGAHSREHWAFNLLNDTNLDWYLVSLCPLGGLMSETNFQKSVVIEKAKPMECLKPFTAAPHKSVS